MKIKKRTKNLPKTHLNFLFLQDGCAAITTSLAKDICNQRSYRSRRRREIFRLKRTILDLEKKIEFLESQVDYYNQYLKQCLANLHVAKKKRVHFKTPNQTVSKVIKLVRKRSENDPKRDLTGTKIGPKMNKTGPNTLQKYLYCFSKFFLYFFRLC